MARGIERTRRSVAAWMLSCMVATLTVSVWLAPGAVTVAEAAPLVTTLALSTFRASVVDPTTGRLFVAGEDKIIVLAPDGSLLGTIPNVYGVGGLAVSGPNLWATETTAGSIARIDIATSTIAQTFVIGTPVKGDIVVHGGLLWFVVAGSGAPSSYSSLATLDPVTGSVIMRGGSFDSAMLRTIPGVGNRILVGVPGSFDLYLVDTSGPTVTVLDDVDHGAASNLGDFEVTADGARVVTASGWPYKFPEFTVATMDASGVEYPGTNYPNSMAARGGLLAGGVSSSRKVFVWAESRPVIAAEFTTTRDILPRGVELGADGARVHAVTNGGNVTVETFPLAASIASVTPSQVVQAVPATVTVSGSNIGGTSAATIGGVAADVTVVSVTQVAVHVPPSVPTGMQQLVLTTPFGSPSTSLSVVANTGVALSGTVRSGGSPAPAVELTLSGGALGAPLTTITGVAGTYGFPPVPYGTTYTLVAHDPTGTYPDQQVERITLVPNGSVVRDLNLQVTPVPSPSLARVTLPAGQPRDVEVEPGSGRVFVSVGDQVVAFDRDGTVLARFEDQFGADGLALGAGSVWVNQRSSGRIVRIDPVSLTVTGSWATGGVSTGGLAYGSGKLLYTNGNEQWVTLAQLDPTTGVVQQNSSGIWYTPRFTNVPGAPNQALVYEQGVSSNAIYAVNTSASPPSVLGSTWTSGGGDWVVSADRDRVWSNSGVERRLSTLAETGVVYPLTGGGSVAYASALGGIIATGRTISRFGIPAASHVLSDTPATRSLALDGTGDRAFLMAAQTFVVADLRPLVISTSPTAAQPLQALTVNGSGLGAATQVTIDGSPAPFTTTNAGELGVSLPALAEGLHRVQVVTPWGTSPPRLFTVGPATAGARFTSLPPARILDTRDGIGAPMAKLGPNATMDLQVTGRGGVPASGVSAVVMNVTVVNPTAQSFLTAWPTGQGRPIASNLNYVAGQVVPNLVVVKVGTDGKVSLFNQDGSTDVIADVAGWYGEEGAAGGARFEPLTPARILDTRTGSGAPVAKLGPFSALNLQVTGRGGVPASGVSAVVMNVTVVNPTAQSFLTAWPTGQGRPIASNLNYVAGQVVPNVVVVKVGTDGKVSLFNQDGSTDVIADVAGWYGDDGAPSGAGFVALPPARVLDTRAGNGAPMAKLGPNATLELQVTGRGGVPSSGVSAVVLNVTVVNPIASSWLTAWPTGQALPTVSNLNYTAGAVVANLVMVKLGTDGRITVNNTSGSTDVVADVAGWFVDVT